MYTRTRDNFSLIYHQTLQDLLASGPYHHPTRLGPTKEFHPATLQLTDVATRSLVLPRRRKNLGLQLMEFLWIYNGSDQLAPLTAVLPRWADYSDNGRTLHGAYGHRLRSAFGLDQLGCVRDRLARNPHDRQAIAMIWHPIKDNIISKDIPCNNWLHFMVRDGKLDLTVAVRSNDLWWGTPYNVFNWTQLQCVLAHQLGIEPGVYTHMADSLHIYETHDKAYQRVLPDVMEYPGIPWPVVGASDEELHVAWEIVNTYLQHGDKAPIDWDMAPTPFWRDYVRALLLILRWKQPGPAGDAWWEIGEFTTDAIKYELLHEWVYQMVKRKEVIPSEQIIAIAEHYSTEQCLYVMEGWHRASSNPKATPQPEVGAAQPDPT